MVDNEAMQVYMKPSSHEESKAPSKGFVVRDAPWATVSNEKVSAASAAGTGSVALPRADSGAWPSRFNWENSALPPLSLVAEKAARGCPGLCGLGKS